MAAVPIRLWHQLFALVMTALTAASLAYCGVVHQPLIDEHRAMNQYSGNSFWAMTAGCYIGAGFTLIAGLALVFGAGRMVRRLARLTLVGIIVAMGGMIGSYFYVHYSTTLPLPWGIEHEGPEWAGTVSVTTESLVIALSTVLLWATRPILRADVAQLPEADHENVA